MRIDYQQLRSALQLALASAELLAARQRARAAYSPGLAYGRHFGPPAPSARQAAVLVMLERRSGQWVIPVTVRPDHLPDHPGQISLPGGRLEAGESYQQAAEREFCEELGCAVEPAQILGELSPLYVYHSDYIVRPFVAISPTAHVYQPCPREVSRVLHLPLAVLCSSSPVASSEFTRGLAVWSAPVIDSGDAIIWGATAIILAELIPLLRGIV
ncbi:MAG: CoA pyrophosphatase [Pirellulaceae bacterium]|nr:CoA pyrophosphatase [Pirellulaceae bacterium]